MKQQQRKKYKILVSLAGIIILIALAIGIKYELTGNKISLPGQTSQAASVSEKSTNKQITNINSSSDSASTSTAAESAEKTSEPIDITKLTNYVAPKYMSGGYYSKKFKNGVSIDYWIFQNDKNVTKQYKPDDNILFDNSSKYTGVEGVLTFRGNNYRDSASWGTADIKQKKLEIAWTHDIGAVSGVGSYWPGAGWTGQPLIVHWPDDTRQAMGIDSEFKNKDLVEVVYPVFDSNIYFLDLETGKPTRKPIYTGFSIKGTGSVDPRGYPLFYTGQGMNENNGKFGPFTYKMFDLIKNKLIYSIPLNDPVAFRKWAASDSSAIVDKGTDTLIEPGENGIIYKVKLNSKFDSTAKTVSLNPQVTKFRYRSSIGLEYGVESSAAYYKNLMLFSDNEGGIVCLDANKLEPVWEYNAKDDSDSTVVLEETKSGAAIYQGNMVAFRGELKQKPPYTCNIRKFDVLTGELQWQYDVPCIFESYVHGGMLSTPLIGKDDISDLVIFNIAKTKNSNTGMLLALDKKTGKMVWSRELDTYSWSSPVSILGKDGKTYGIYCDFKGNMNLFNPRTGEILDKIFVGGNVEASPAIYNNMVVVGTYGKKIYGVKIK